MIYVALAALAALAATTLASAATVRSLIRQQARERDLLINQICNLAGRPWQTPPAAEPPPPDDEPEYADYGLTGPMFVPDE